MKATDPTFFEVGTLPVGHTLYGLDVQPRSGAAEGAMGGSSLVEAAQRTGTAGALTGGTDSSYLASWIVVKVKGVRQSPGMGDDYYPSFSSKPADEFVYGYVNASALATDAGRGGHDAGSAGNAGADAKGQHQTGGSDGGGNQEPAITPVVTPGTDGGSDGWVNTDPTKGVDKATTTTEDEDQVRQRIVKYSV